MSFQALLTHDSPLALRTFDIKVSVFGWSAYILVLVVYCTLYNVIVESGQPDITGSLVWSLKFWAFWPLLTLAALTVLRRYDSTRNKQALLLQLGAAALLIAVAFRVFIDLMTDPQSIGSTLVLSFPRYLAAIIVVTLIWFLCLRKKKDEPALAEDFAGTDSAETDRAPLADYPDTLLVTKGSDDCLIRVDGITCICAAGNYVEIYCGQQAYLLRATMKQVEEKLPPGKFIRIHRSHIVKLDDVERIKTQPSGNGTLKLRCGRELRISKKYKSQLQKYRLQAA